MDCLGKAEVHNLCGQPVLSQTGLGCCECPSDDDVATYRDKPINPKKTP
jgi:hypothetical protein